MSGSESYLLTKGFLAFVNCISLLGFKITNDTGAEIKRKFVGGTPPF